MKMYMIWIPGKIIGIWDNSADALKGFCDYLANNEENLKVIKMTVYERTYKTGKELETVLTGQELMDIINEEDKR